jgi:hypothetical protein
LYEPSHFCISVSAATAAMEKRGLIVLVLLTLL